MEGDAQSYLIGIRHLTTFDLTTIIEYYHNGTGFSVDEMKNYYAFIDRGYNLYQTTGNTAILGNAQQMAEAGYGRSSAMAELSVRPFQPERTVRHSLFHAVAHLDDEHGRPRAGR